MQFPELKYEFDYSIVRIENDLSIAYTDEGNEESKETLLFIHGLSSYIPAWSKLIPLLRNDFRCIAVDLPGYGKSSAGVHSGSMNFYADVISEFVQKLGLNKVILVGHSMGGHISIATVLKYPKIIDKLILLAPAGFETFTDDEKLWIRRNNSPEILAMLSEKQIRYNYEMNFYKMPDDVEPMIKDRIEMKQWINHKDYCRIVHNSLIGLLESPVFDQLHKITQPALVIFGKNDRLIPHSMLHKNLTSERIGFEGASQISNSKLLFIEECGHFLQFEREDPVSSHIKEFLMKSSRN